MTLLTGNGSSGTMIYNFAFLAVMAVIYLAGLFGGMFRVDSIGEALARGTQELSSIFKVPGKAKSEDLSCLKGMFEHKYLDDRMDSFVDAMEKNQEGIGDVEDYINEDEIDLHVHKKILEMAPDILPALVFLVLLLVWYGGLRVLSHPAMRNDYLCICPGRWYQSSIPYFYLWNCICTDLQFRNEKRLFRNGCEASGISGEISSLCTSGG